MKESKPMQEVHEWRRKIYEEDKHLSRKQRIEKTKRIAEEAAQRYGLKLRRPDKSLHNRTVFFFSRGISPSREIAKILQPLL